MSDSVAVSVARPWDRPWWSPLPSQRKIFGYLVVVHLLAALGLVLFPIPDLQVALAVLVLATLGGFGTTICYHRSLSHKALRLNPIVEQALVFLAVFNGSGVPRRWVSNHRVHHANSDTEDDISSPRQGGFWWAHLRCLYQVEDGEDLRWSPDLAAARYNVWTQLQPVVLVLAFASGFIAFGWQGFFWMGALRLVYSLHIQCFVNSIQHMGPEGQGGEDSSLNIWWLGPFQLGAWGENWHRNHHAEASAARFGRTWFQTDIGWYLIRVLEKLRLAVEVRRDRNGPVSRVRLVPVPVAVAVAVESEARSRRD